MQKCEGVWLYLHYVVSEIWRGEQPALDLEALPTGLGQYYASFWHNYRASHEADWHRWYEPLLSTLAVIQEAVPLDRLVALSGIAATKPADLKQLADVLAGDWAPFVRCSVGGRDLRALPPHVALVSPRRSRGADARRTRPHRRPLPDRWGGLERGLPDLPEVPRPGDATWSEPSEQRYGRRYLALHLATAGAEQRAQLFELLTLDAARREGATKPRQRHHLDGSVCHGPARPSPRSVHGGRQIGGTPTTRTPGWSATTSSQVNLAWRRAEDQSRQSDGDRGSSMGWQLRFALMQSSINARAESLPVDLLLALVRCGRWDAYQAWAFADRIPALAGVRWRSLKWPGC